jgi:hypothetical protein
VTACDDREFRLSIWRAHGATETQAAELVAYAASPLHRDLPARRAYPLADAPCIADWQRYADEARGGDGRAAALLRRVLVQLRFPIAGGMSRDPAYRAATLDGDLPDLSGGVPFVQPDDVDIFLYATPAGQVPVVHAAAREDFELLVRAIMHRNEPVSVPASMGACLVAGYNNWDRIDRLRREFAAEHPEDRTGAAWDAVFPAMTAKDRYQDRFMLVSSGPYSATPAAAMRLTDAEWLAASLRLRLAHEATHYVTRQAFGVMRMSLLDELVADHLGLVHAFGAFRAEAFLRFMGIEAFPSCRADGRLENYRGSPPLADDAFALLRPIVVRVARQLEALDPSRQCQPFDLCEQARVTIALLRVGLEGLVADDAPARLARGLEDAAACVDRA